MEPTTIEKLPTGIPEFDLVLRGGLPKGRVHLIEGEPGTGKTTFALQFLIEAASSGPALYITMSESAEELRAAAATHGWSLDGIDIFELIPAEALPEEQQTVLYPAEAELGATVRRIIERIEATNPDRVVIDSISELRLLASDSLRFRRQVLQLKHFLQGRHCTTLILDDETAGQRRELHSVVHGVILLEQWERTFGASRRRLRISKMRGSVYQSGWHDFVITPGKILVFPSLIAEEHEADFPKGAVSSNLPELDALVGGGLDRGTVTMLVGPSGSGKSSLALRYADSASRRGEVTSYFAFDETWESFSQRARSLGLDPGGGSERGSFHWERMHPTRLSPGEFVWRVRRSVEDEGTRVVVIDSLNSYLSTMPEEETLILQMHELLNYLNNKGIVTILILAQQGVLSDVKNPVDLSFLSDTVILLRYFEARSEVRKAISVIKKRSGIHELMIREYQLFPNGMRVGPPLSGLRGVLTGVPVEADHPVPLLDRPDDA